MTITINNEICVISPTDWITDGQTGKQYLVLDLAGDLVYDDNKQACHDLGGFLPEPRDERENQFLDSLCTDMFQLGLTDRDVEGQWVWDSDGSLVTWESWIWNEPDGGLNENCMVMARTWQTSKAGHRSEGWIDVLCQSELEYYTNFPKNLICQRNPGEFRDCALGKFSFLNTHFRAAKH